MLTLRDSPDELIRDAGIETRTSRKWSATDAVKQAENTPKHKDIVGVTTVGRQGIGATNKMAATPMYGKNPFNIFFSGTSRAISTKLGI